MKTRKLQHPAAPRQLTNMLVSFLDSQSVTPVIHSSKKSVFRLYVGQSINQ